MKLLVLSHLYPNRMRQGTGTFVAELVRHLSPHCEVSVIAPVPRAPFPLSLLGTYRRADVPEWEAQPIPVSRPGFWIGPRHLGFRYAGPSYWCAIQASVRRFSFDVIHAHQPYPDGYAAARLKAATGRPLVITIHGDPLLQRIRRSPALRAQVAPALQAADAIIVVAKYQCAFLEELGVCELDKVLHISNGADIERFGPAADLVATRRRLGLPASGKLLLYVGHLYAPKGMPVLIKAAWQLRTRRGAAGWKLVIVGSGPLEGSVRRQRDQLGLADQIIMVGGKAHSEIPEWMAACDVLVLPSLQEGSPTVIPEALASGLPVVSTTVGGIPETISSPDLGTLVPPGDADALADALDAALTRAWNRAALVQYSRCYAWDNIAGQTLKLYHSVVERAI